MGGSMGNKMGEALECDHVAIEEIFGNCILKGLKFRHSAP